MAKKKKNNSTEVVEGSAPVDALGGADLATTNAPVAKPKKGNAKADKNKKPNVFVRIGRSFKGMFAEMKHVTWPEGKTVLSSTLVVLGVVFIFFIGLLGIDSGLSALLNLLLKH